MEQLAVNFETTNKSWRLKKAHRKKKKLSTYLVCCHRCHRFCHFVKSITFFSLLVLFLCFLLFSYSFFFFLLFKSSFFYSFFCLLLLSESVNKQKELSKKKKKKKEKKRKIKEIGLFIYFFELLMALLFVGKNLFLVSNSLCAQLLMRYSQSLKIKIKKRKFRFYL